MTRILVWGFYDQGNFGDDLMALMVANIVRSLGAEPIVLSSNPRFRRLGYTAVSSIESASPHAVVLGGGAFIKSGKTSSPQIQARLEELSSFLDRTSTPIIGISLGSDGVRRLDDASATRRAVLASTSCKAIAVRLEQDLELGLPGAVYLPDIVLASRYFRGIWGGETTSLCYTDPFFINLSRRTAWKLPKSVWLGRGKRRVLFHAHSGRRTGGEIALPFAPRFTADDIAGTMDSLAGSEAICSSKLHPGVVALSMGSEFISVAPRPKTVQFIKEAENHGYVHVENLRGNDLLLRSQFSLEWQQNLWTSYSVFIADQLRKAGVLS